MAPKCILARLIKADYNDMEALFIGTIKGFHSQMVKGRCEYSQVNVAT